MLFFRSLIILLGILLATSCRLFSSYPDIRYQYYHSLSKQEKAEVSARGTLLKNWVGTSSAGDTVQGPLLVSRYAKGKFAFTELGTWLYRYRGWEYGGWQATVLDSITHDEQGNIRYRALYLHENQDSIGLYLHEKWTSTQTDSLCQTVTGYYTNGQVRARYGMTVLHPMETVNDEDKEKKIFSIECYDETGQPISQQQAEARAYEWHMPPIRMKKQH